MGRDVKVHGRILIEAATIPDARKLWEFIVGRDNDAVNIEANEIVFRLARETAKPAQAETDSKGTRS